MTCQSTSSAHSDDEPPGPHIVVVGPCAAGKTTLVSNLQPRGYNIHSCVQEHSFSPQLWRKLSKAEVLIFLDAQLETIARRQHRSDWTQARLDAQRQRLSDARQHCDLYVGTDGLTPQEVADRVEAFLRRQGIAPTCSADAAARNERPNGHGAM